MRAHRLLATLLVGAFLIGEPALAHQASDSYLRLRPAGEHWSGEWDIALRDLDVALGLDGDDDGAITWGEVRSARTRIESYALARLKLSADSTHCPLTPTALLVDRHTDGTYAVLRWRAACPATAAILTFDYRLLFDLDPRHRGLLSVTLADGSTRTAVFRPEAPTHRLELGAGGVRQFLTFVGEGVTHIWTGFDHVLFLLALLLPAVFSRQSGRWLAIERLGDATGNVVKVVTAFTVAHSLTLVLAALGLAVLPARLVESTIAASVIAAACNNLVPLVRGRHWLLAFGFGLIHGFGFAGVLTDLGLDHATLIPTLLGFNLGVELGQLAIVAAFLPVAFRLRHTRLYRDGAFVGGSLAVAAVAALWLAERSLDWKILP